MKKTLKINENAQTMGIPKEMISEGYVGYVDVLMNALTVTIIHPKADLEDVRTSLRIVLQDVELRMRAEQNISEIDWSEASTDDLKRVADSKITAVKEMVKEKLGSH